MSENKLVDDVIDFNQVVLGIQPRLKGLLIDSEAEISYKCLLEEANEFMGAVETSDYIGCIDSILDSMYFAAGILYKLGLTSEEVDKCMSAVHLCNMTKKKGINSKRATGAADAIKPDGWISPEERIKEILEL